LLTFDKNTPLFEGTGSWKNRLNRLRPVFPPNRCIFFNNHVIILQLEYKLSLPDMKDPARLIGLGMEIKAFQEQAMSLSGASSAEAHC
jgi:hypothetical protein